MKFMFDNNLSIHLAAAVNALCRQERAVDRVLHIKDLFPGNTDDIVWLHGLKEHGSHWIVVTHDKLKKRAGAEREAFRQNQLVGYVLDPQWNHQGFWPIAERLVEWWPIILEHVKTARTGVYRVPWKTGTARRLTSF
ncbi:hypothetical protein ACTJKJ_23395 [Roseateles sp. 22389]|uniref:PIN-like domain-containing protein n=1 Tax=Roseateles sp. 22389 TaxID=3453916 RepID=UPI002620D65E|nr:hypothetical protein [uncultured Roseateles sp.]